MMKYSTYTWYLVWAQRKRHNSYHALLTLKERGHERPKDKSTNKNKQTKNKLRDNTHSLSPSPWLFRTTLLKWGTGSIVWESSDEYSLSRNTNLRSNIQKYNFFFRQDNLSVYVFIVLTLFTARSSHQSRGVL